MQPTKHTALARWMLVFALVFLTGTALADTRLLRFPDVHGNQVVFSYGGDLWAAPTTGGTAWRLTSHPGLELFPKFSPDGRWIAFTGQYGGDEQVYVIPASGGEPDQLTWYPSSGPLPPRWGYDNQVYGWTPDGESVLFRSLRDAWGSSSARLYTVARTGGMPEALPMPVSGAGVFSDDGSKVFYSPLFRDFRTWKRYEGGWAQDLWLFDLSANDARQITDHPRTERDPMWINGQGYFVSDRDGTLNLYSVDVDSGEVEQLTHHDDFDVRWASADREGQIVYEHGGRLRIFNTADGSDTGLEIHVPDDGINRRARMVDVSDQIHGARLSPTGKRVLFEARGSLFSAPVGDGVARQVTHGSDAHDREADWSPDGRQVVFVSDQSGEEELYIAPVDGSESPKALTSNNRTRFYQPRFSPDGKHVAVSDKDGNIYVIAASGKGGLKKVGRDTGWRNRDYVWSPDGQWLAFSLTENSELRAVHIYSVSEERTRRVTEGLFSEYEPAFSHDGKLLAFLADREYSPQIAGREWNYANNRMTGIYAYLLDESATNPFAPEDAEEKGMGDSADSGNGSDKENSGQKTRIDFDGLQQRLIRVPVDPGNYSTLALSETGILFGEHDAFYYGRAPAELPRLKLYSFDDKKVVDFAERVFGGQTSLDGSHVLVRSGSQWQVYPVAKQGKESELVDTTGLRAWIDPVAEWATIFDEVWRRYRDYFYVENMHGYDWEALREQYRPLLAHVSNRSDLNYLLGEMIAELNISHAYVGGGDEQLPERPSVSLLGARFEIDQGRYRIARILEGDNSEPRYRSPLERADLDVAEGDYILAINGQPLHADENIFRRLTLPGNQAVALTVASSPGGSNSREILVEPVSGETSLFYLDWVVGNYRRVTEATDGRVGYIYVPDMGPDGIREFTKWFYGQIDREGLIIDVRSNGGGNVSAMLIERLSRRPLSLGYSRTMPNATTYPQQAFNGHMAAVLDENSASDGDIFPWQFRNAGLGPLIGKKSWGGVTGITDHGPLIDGGSVSVPEFGFLNIDGEWVIEGVGVEPDIEVDNDPASVIAGEDPQLQRAIDEVMQRIESDPPRFPDRPADPVKTD